MGSLIRVFPLILLVVIAYSLVVGGVAVSGVETLKTENGQINMVAMLDQTLFRIPLPSAPWDFTVGTLFVTFALFLMFIELVKSTNTDTVSITNHALSLLVMVVALLLFILAPGYNTSVFFYVLVMTVIDVIAGFTVTISNARRDFSGSGVVV